MQFSKILSILSVFAAASSTTGMLGPRYPPLHCLQPIEPTLTPTSRLHSLL
jgi:hypothetical protein